MEIINFVLRFCYNLAFLFLKLKLFADLHGYGTAMPGPGQDCQTLYAEILATHGQPCFRARPQLRPGGGHREAAGVSRPVRAPGGADRSRWVRMT